MQQQQSVSAASVAAVAGIDGASCYLPGSVTDTPNGKCWNWDTCPTLIISPSSALMNGVSGASGGGLYGAGLIDYTTSMLAGASECQGCGNNPPIPNGDLCVSCAQQQAHITYQHLEHEHQLEQQRRYHQQQHDQLAAAGAADDDSGDVIRQQHIGSPTLAMQHKRPRGRQPNPNKPKKPPRVSLFVKIRE